MSSAAREPLRGDELPALIAATTMIAEAAPDPAPGPIRDDLAAQGAARVDTAVALMEQVIRAYNERVAGVVLARLKGPKARKNTRFWSDQVKDVSGRGVVGSSTHTSLIETKALDASYVLPDRVVDELEQPAHRVALRIVANSSSAAAKRLGRPNTGLAAFDWAHIESAVDSVVRRLMDVNERHARDIRQAILAADSTAANLDEVIDRVAEALRRGGNWLLLSGRTLATALAGDAALGAARALGVTHTQWLSRRDGRVRHTHVVADGQVRPITGKFKVGAFRLRFPADPTELPASWPEVANCRCSLLFAAPNPARQAAIGTVDKGTPGSARQLVADAATAAVATRAIGVPAPTQVLSAPELGAGLTVPAVVTRAPVVGYRVLDELPVVEPGQRISWPGALALALAPPAVVAGAVLAVAIPAGVAVGVANGAMALPESTVLAVASVTAGQIVAAPE